MSLSVFLLSSKFYWSKMMGLFLVSFSCSIWVLQSLDSFFYLIFLIMYVSAVFVLLLYSVSLVPNSEFVWSSWRSLILLGELSLVLCFSMPIYSSTGSMMSQIILFITCLVIILALPLFQPLLGGSMR